MYRSRLCDAHKRQWITFYICMLNFYIIAKARFIVLIIGYASEREKPLTTIKDVF